MSSHFCLQVTVFKIWAHIFYVRSGSHAWQSQGPQTPNGALSKPYWTMLDCTCLSASLYISMDRMHLFYVSLDCSGPYTSLYVSLTMLDRMHLSASLCISLDHKRLSASLWTVLDHMCLSVSLYVSLRIWTILDHTCLSASLWTVLDCAGPYASLWTILDPSTDTYIICKIWFPCLTGLGATHSCWSWYPLLYE